jgi:predicted amidohydrolase YtcJ
MTRHGIATPLLLLLAAAVPGPLASQSAQAIVGATLLDGTGSAPVADAVVVVRDGRIVCAGARRGCPVPRGARQVDARGAWIIPGLIDAHVHFSQTGWFDGRPDAADLRRSLSLRRGRASLAAHPERFFRCYLAAGSPRSSTSAVPWTWSLRDRFAGDPRAAHRRRGRSSPRSTSG